MIDQKYLKECLQYDPSSGSFIWLKRPKNHFYSDRAEKAFNSRYPSLSAGKKKSSGNTKYLIITIDAIQYRAHRLAFLYMTGKLPDESVDHIDHDGLNNSWVNLRQCSNHENCLNRPLQKNNTSGVCGVTFNNRKRKWSARIKHNRKDHHLGYFKSKTMAILARKKAEKEFGFHENHGEALS